jgi:signal transduction histidine kinase
MQRIFPPWLFVGDRIDYAWLVFAIANLAAMAALVELDGPHGLETVPFHFVYVSFTILYGFRAWRAGRVVAGITFVALSTGLMTLLAIHAGREDWAELTEVPLMTLMFLAMVFHVRRRQQATATAERLAADLRENLDRQRGFVSDASHELLTPITIGRGHLEVLERLPQPSRDDIDDAITVVIGELDRMDRVISRLLLLESASTPGFVTPVAEPITGFLQELFHRWVGTGGRTWQLSAIAPGTVPLDRDRMMLAMDALLENAVRHTQPGGTIAIGADHHGDQLELSVSDDGDGVPPEAQSRVFDRFYRVDRSRNRRVGGAGLGLSIVRAVVTAHGGSVSLSGGAGHGTRVSVLLPGFRSTGEQPVPAATHSLDANAGLELTP